MLNIFVISDLYVQRDVDNLFALEVVNLDHQIA